MKKNLSKLNFKYFDEHNIHHKILKQNQQNLQDRLSNYFVNVNSKTFITYHIFAPL